MGCIFTPELIHPTPQPLPPKSSNPKIPVSGSDHRCNSQQQNYSLATQNITEVREPINGEALILVDRAIARHFLFYGLSQGERYDLIKMMKRYSAMKDQYIFRKGDPAYTFFIIISGKVQIQTGLEQTKYLEKGQSFGQLALIYEAPRSVSIVARSQTILWGIESNIFASYINRLKHKNFTLIRNFLDKVPFFTFMTDKEKQNIVMSSHRFRYEAGSKIFSINDPANSIFVIIDGRIEMDIPNKPKVLFQKGQMFGQGCLLGYEFRSGTAECIQPTECLSISKTSLLKQLDAPTNNILLYCICKWSLKRSSIFNLLKRTTVDRIILSGEMRIVPDGELIEAKGKPTHALYICLEGKINGDGVGAIFNQIPEQSGISDLVKYGTGFVFTIKFQTLTRIINRPLKTFVQTKQKRVRIKMEHLGNVDDFIIISKIKENSYCEFLQVTTFSQPKSKYCLHCLKKNPIIEQQKQLKIHSYIKTLQKLSHPLLPKLAKIFPNDPDYIFLATQFTGLLTLADLLQQLVLKEEAVKFYSLCAIDMVEYLHGIGVMHGGIGARKFFIGENGYLYGDQLGAMKEISKDSKSGNDQVKEIESKYRSRWRSSSMIEMPHYGAPELIMGQSVGLESDLWSLGILIYEMIYGVVPFAAGSTDPIEIYQKILENNLTFPDPQLLDEQSLHQEQKQIVENLLKLNRKQRTPLSKIKQKYYPDIEFNKIRDFSMKAPQIRIKASKRKSQRYSIFPRKMMNSIQEYFGAQRKILGAPHTSDLMPNWANFDN